MEQDIFILDGARTAIGTFGGALSTFTPAELGVIAAKSAIERSGVAAADLDNAVAGNVIPNSPRDLYLGRVIGMESGLPASAPGLTLNRLCGSGAQAIATAASMIRAGESRLSLAVGSEVMSRAPYSIDSLRKGQKMGDAGLTDWLLGSNEAFAAQAIAVNRLLGLPLEKVNPNGGAIALGHPLGATGVILTVKALYELERIGGRYGLVTMCIGGGQGIALVIENCLANRA
jgi:acetyl-CoA acetyltransferase